MKTTILFVALLLVCSFVNAQDEYSNDQIQTIFSKNRSNGGYGALTMSYSNIGGRDAFVSGARGAFIFDHSFAIGLGGYGFVNNLDYNYYYNGSNNNNGNELSLAGGYGGIFIEPIIAGRSPVHLSFPILIGAGGISLVDLNGWEHWDSYHPVPNVDYDVYFVVEPAVELEFNLARFFRMAATASYRYTSNINLFETDVDALRGFNFGLTFKFGKF